MMEDFVNMKLYDTNKNDLNKVNEMRVDNKEGEETKEIENEDVIKMGCSSFR